MDCNFKKKKKKPIAIIRLFYRQGSWKSSFCAFLSATRSKLTRAPVAGRVIFNRIREVAQGRRVTMPKLYYYYYYVWWRIRQCPKKKKRKRKGKHFYKKKSRKTFYRVYRSIISFKMNRTFSKNNLFFRVYRTFVVNVI